MNTDDSFERLLEELCKLPSVGPKLAQRIAYFILQQDADESMLLAQAIIDVKERVHFCTQCFNYASADLCDICSDPRRDAQRICVVAEPRDIGAIERTHAFDGTYHVLGGLLNPMNHIGPDQLRIKELMARLANDQITEVIVATNPTVEGETTAAYLARMIKPLNIEVTRPASGLPCGGELEYADEITLTRAITDRRSL